MADITVQDFDNVVRIIDIVTQRGAFRGEELKGVSEVREKFAEAVQKFVSEQQKEGAPEEAAETVEKSLPKKANSEATSTAN